MFGHEIVFGGLVVNDERIDLGKYSANFIDLAISPQWGSCPYLSSLDRGNGDWLEHGKILHSASAPEREYVETRAFPGLRPHFRIEEREPEVAFIDHLELSVALKNGDTLVLNSDQPELRARDQRYLKLYWNDAVDIRFEVPLGVPESDVTESRLSVTGYYQSYSALLSLSPTNSIRRSSKANNLTLVSRTSPSTNLVCPLLMNTGPRGDNSEPTGMEASAREFR